jgi:hypothetical protein
MQRNLVISKHMLGIALLNPAYELLNSDEYGLDEIYLVLKNRGVIL